MTVLGWTWAIALMALGLGAGLGLILAHRTGGRRHAVMLQQQQREAEQREQAALAQVEQFMRCQQEGEARFLSFVAALPDATLLLNADGQVMQASPAAQRLLGWPADTALPLAPATYLRLANPAQALALNEQLHRSVQDLFGQDECQTLLTSDDKGRPLSLELWPWRSQLKAQPCLILLCRDLSHTVQLRDTATQLTEQLAREQRAHAQALAQERLRAESSARAKDEFLANMSHELRTPLHVVLGQAHLASQGAQGAQALQMQRLSDAARQLLDLLNDVLEFADKDGGHAEPSLQDADLSLLMGQASQDWHELAGQKGLEIVTWLGETVPTAARLDDLRIRRVLNKLMGNAVKFTAQGHITLQVSRLLSSSGDPTLRFEVRDTGIGIPAEVLRRLGEPFSQVDGSATRTAGGTGLGLALCRRLLHRMGSTLQAASEPGRGARFWFDLPLQIATMACGLPDSAPAPSPTRRALVVEDLADARAAHTAHLARLGYDVQSAASAAEAQLAVGHAEALDTAFDVCLIDESLGDVTAAELARRITTAARRRPPQLVLMSCAAADDGSAPGRLPEAFATCCQKPATPGMLADALARVAASHAEPLPHPAVSAHLASTPTAPDEAWPPITGLDTGIGMRIVRGDSAKFERLLRRFVQSHRDDPDHLRAHAARAQHGQAVEIAHTLKGTAGSLGAKPVADAAAALCAGISKGSSQQHGTLIMGLAGELARLLVAIEASLEDRAATQSPARLPQTHRLALERQDLAKRLRALIAQRDMSPLRFARENEMAIRTALGGAAAGLLQAIQAFDYDLAMSLLDRCDQPADHETHDAAPLP